MLKVTSLLNNINRIISKNIFILTWINSNHLNHFSSDSDPTKKFDNSTQTIQASKVLNRKLNQISDRQCTGCGIGFQISNPKLPGYIDSDSIAKVDSANLHHIVCQRCYELRYKSKHNKISLSLLNYTKKILSINYYDSIIFLIVDVLFYPVGINPNLNKYIPSDTPIYLVGNKIDLLNLGSNPNAKRIRSNIKSLLENHSQSNSLKGCNVKGSMLISAKTQEGLNHMKTIICNNYKGKNVYLLGCTNSGKSTLFNLLQNDLWVLSHSEHKFTSSAFYRSTVSRIPGTTFGLLNFPIPIKKDILNLNSKISMYEEGLYKVYDPEGTGELSHPVNQLQVKDLKQVRALLYDTPGVDDELQVSSYLSHQEQKYILPELPIRKRWFMLIPNQALLFGKIGKLELLEFHSTKRTKLSIAAFFSNLLYIKTIPIGSENKFKNHNTISNAQTIPQLMSKEITLYSEENSSQTTKDVIFSNIGWVSILVYPSEEITLKVYTPNQKGIVVRNSFLTYKKKEEN